ncbi:hypothetical protein DFJ74DRAFT_588905, partial [Hyaloraphidium curvatum]
SFGMLCYQCFAREAPFNDTRPEAVGVRICRGERPQRPYDVPDALWRMMQLCWEPDPARRPAATQL